MPVDSKLPAAVLEPSWLSITDHHYIVILALFALKGPFDSILSIIGFGVILHLYILFSTV